MPHKGSHKIKELPKADEGHADSIAAIKDLASQYRDAGRPATGESRDSLSLIRNLAADFQSEHRSVLNAQGLRILTPHQARVHIYRANPHAKIEEIRSGVVTFEEIPLGRLPKLPPSYGFKGGAARLALAALLGKNVKNRKPRDWDIFRVGQTPVAGDDDIARKYMPDDFKYGNGVELVGSIRAYLHSRDLTINQVALIEGRVFCTFAAIEDTLNAVLRPTEQLRHRGGAVHGRITMKMVRMMAEARLEGSQFQLAEPAHRRDVSPFEIALHLDRVLTRGTRAAQYYLELCAALGYIEFDKSKETVGDVCAALKAKIKNNSGAPARNANKRIRLS